MTNKTNVLPAMNMGVNSYHGDTDGFISGAKANR